MPWLLVAFGLLALPARCLADVQAYLQFVPYNNGAIPAGDSTNTNYPAAQGWSQIPAVSTDVIQTLSIGSQSSGAGAGKIVFNALNIQKLVNSLSPTLFKNAAAGTAYKFAYIVFTRTGVDGQPFPYFKITLGLVAVQTQSWALPSDGADLTELVGFQYGGMALTFTPQRADGSAGTPVTQGWNRVANVQWDGTTVIN